MKKLRLELTEQQYESLVKILDRRTKIKSGEIHEFASVRFALRNVKVMVETDSPILPIPEADSKRVEKKQGA